MEEIIKKDESVLTGKEKELLYSTLEKMEQYFPEHKVYAFDALCSQHRKKALSFSKQLGYESVDDFLHAYGYELISGEAVYELRKNCGIKPGEEPELLKNRIDKAISSLDEFYPDHIVDSAIKKEHKGLSMNLTGYYQWLGYRSLAEMLDAYGFTYSFQGQPVMIEKGDGTAPVNQEHQQNVGRGGRPADDLNAIVEELIGRYEGDRYVNTIAELKGENPDLSPKFKNIQNKSNELFGMSFNKYLKKRGVLGPKEKSPEELAAQAEAFRRAAIEKDIEDLKGFDEMFQKEYLGWKKLPSSSTALIKGVESSKIRRRIIDILGNLNINAEDHFREIWVLRTSDTDNELRELIQHIDFTAFKC